MHRVYSIKEPPKYVIAENKEEALKTFGELMLYSAEELPLKEKEARIKVFWLYSVKPSIGVFAVYEHFKIEYTCKLNGDFTCERIKLITKTEGTITSCIMNGHGYKERFDDTVVFDYLIKNGYNPYDVLESFIKRIMLKLTEKYWSFVNNVI